MLIVKRRGKIYRGGHVWMVEKVIKWAMLKKIAQLEAKKKIKAQKARDLIVNTHTKN